MSGRDPGVEPPEAEAPLEAPLEAPPPRWWLALYWLLPAIVYAAFIFYLSSQANPLPGLSTRFSDKLLHLVEYAAFGAVATWGFSHLVRLPRAARWAALVGSLYGLSDEFHQRFVPHRSADVADWVADTIGSALGALLAWLVLRRWRARASIGR
jgi:VanZ family protein